MLIGEALIEAMTINIEIDEDAEIIYRSCMLRRLR